MAAQCPPVALSRRVFLDDLTIMSNSPYPSPRVAIIGCGLVGEKRMKLLAPGTVTVVCDLNLARAQKLAALSPGCEATDSVERTVMSPNVACVMIATLNAALAPIAKQALAAGKHVLAEKPGAISLREMEELEVISKQTGALYRVGYNHRYHPAFQIGRAHV